MFLRDSKTCLILSEGYFRLQKFYIYGHGFRDWIASNLKFNSRNRVTFRSVRALTGSDRRTRGDPNCFSSGMIFLWCGQSYMSHRSKWWSAITLKSKNTAETVQLRPDAGSILIVRSFLKMDVLKWVKQFIFICVRKLCFGANSQSFNTFWCFS